MERVSVDVKSGVYLDKSGNYIVVGLGVMTNKETGAVSPAIQITGLNDEGEEDTMHLVLREQGHVESIENFAKLIHHSEYLGEL